MFTQDQRLELLAIAQRALADLHTATAKGDSAAEQEPRETLRTALREYDGKPAFQPRTSRKAKLRAMHIPHGFNGRRHARYATTPQELEKAKQDRLRGKHQFRTLAEYDAARQASVASASVAQAKSSKAK